MATKDIDLTTDWKQVTDGTQTVQIQPLNMTVWVRDSPAKPSANAKGHPLRAEQWLGITPPQQIWARTSGGTTTILVT
ncbi:UNVERIFIED_ORG: hypothetical protein OKW14_001536 [Pantoea brenneri]|nr:hypothetical protein [Pantoea brenneri]